MASINSKDFYNEKEELEAKILALNFSNDVDVEAQEAELREQLEIVNDIIRDGENTFEDFASNYGMDLYDYEDTEEMIFCDADEFLSGVPQSVKWYFDYEKWVRDCLMDYSSIVVDGIEYYALSV